MSDREAGVSYWIRRWLRGWKLYEPAYCRNCGGLSFTEAMLDGRYRRLICDDCEYVHGVTFSGEWRAREDVGDRSLHTESDP